MSWLTTLSKIGLGVAAPFTGGASLLAMPAVDAIGAGLSGASKAKAANRGTKYEGQMDLERVLLDREKQLQDMQIGREQEGRTGATDAYRKLMAAQHVMTPSTQTRLSPYSVAPRQATDMERTGADAMSQEVMKRLQGGNPIPTVQQHASVIDPKLLDPSKSEGIMGWLGAALGGYANAATGMAAARAKPKTGN